MAVQAVQYIVDVIEHKHDYSIIFNDLAAFFGIFTYMGGVEGLLTAFGKFVMKEIAFQMQPKANSLDEKEWATERMVIVRINDIVDAYYDHVNRVFSVGHKDELQQLADLFAEGSMDVSTHDFQLSFRRKLVQRMLNGRYTPSRCTSKACVGHPIPMPGSDDVATFKSDLKTRQVKYLEEIGIDWWNLYNGLDGWQPKKQETYKCKGMLPGLKSRGHGVHCEGHWRDLLPLVRQVVYNGEVIREKALTHG